MPAESTRPAPALRPLDGHCLRAALEVMQLGVTIVDTRGTIIYANPADAAMHGYTVEELLGRNVGVFSVAEDRNPLTPQRLDAMTSWQRESTNRRKDGSTFPVRLLSDVVRDPDGAPCGVITTCEDITRRVVSEEERAVAHRHVAEQLRQMQKVEALGQLTGGIAHDFNNLLSVILANTELLAPTLAEGDPRAAIAADIAAAARDGANLVARLLGFSRRADLVRYPMSLGACVEDQVPLLRRLIREDVSITVRVDSPASVNADAGAVAQMLMNLITNARDAMPSGGSIRLTVSACTLDDLYTVEHPWVSPGSYVCLEVSDQGCGMDSAVLARVFEPFYTTKPTGQGTGLGMSMIFGLMKQHDGFVHVYSEPGHGTSVRLFFPLVEATPARLATTRPDASRPAANGQLVLLVEDDPGLRRTSERALRAFGYQVLLAANGAEAFEILQSRSTEIDLVLTDLVMPQMGGRALHAAVRAAGGTVPFLFASGYSAEDIHERGHIDPTDRFLRKPWSLDELAGTVSEILSARI